jgi:hypothetical protein
VGQFGIEPADAADMAEPAPDGEGAAKARRPKPQVDLAAQAIVWPGHGLKDGETVRFVGAPTNWPMGLEVVGSGMVFYVKPRGADWVELHDGRVMNETSRVIFAGLPANTAYTLKSVPGEFMLDNPRGAGQTVNPGLVGDIAGALDKVVELGGSYSLDSDSSKVIYVGLVGPGVRRDSVREPVLAQLTVLKDLKYLEIWRDPSIARNDWPEYVDLLKAFNQKVPDCSISMAVPTTLWVRSMVPTVVTGDDEEGPQEVRELTLKIRAINLTPFYTIANRDFAAMVVKTINGHEYFGADPETEEGSTLSDGMLDVATEAMFFDFSIKVKLQEPLLLNDLGGAGRLAGGAAEGEPAEPGEPETNGKNKEF